MRNSSHVWLVAFLFSASLCVVVSVAAARGGREREAKEKPIPASAKKMKNPVKPTRESLERGRKLFLDNCAGCHGKNGNGKGSAARRLRVKPANFTNKKAMRARSDGELFWLTSYGRKPMPPFRGVIGERDRWHLVNYIRSLSRGSGK